MASKFHQILRTIGKACKDTTLTEAEVEKIFQEKGFFNELGYEGFGKDLLAQRGRSRKRFDVALLAFGGRVHTVIEFKRVDAGSLESFKDELYDKYVKPQLAVFGALANGQELLVYARVNGRFVEQARVTLAETSEAQARSIEECFRKNRVNLEALESVVELLRYHRQNPLLISNIDSEAARIFFQVFQLRPESAFGRLVYALKEVLPKTALTSKFTRGSYEFWLKTYARELKYKDVPASWRDFLIGKSSAEISQFSFALETGYTIVSRLMLAKAADDRGFPGVRFVPRIQESLNELAVRGRLKPENHLEIVGRSFRRASEALFSTIFLQDIFDWWFECASTDSRALFLAMGEALLAVTQFDFLELSGDLLGELYQLYFDRDTRKALGEFYTPEEVIEFILDECGYKGQRGHRLLDPACGSGSFLAAALRRYLAQQAGSDPQRVLSDLTDGLRIVGFDINPFAVLMAQVNYAALILPLYAEAIHKDPDFRILRLPVFRTDSLRIEEREEEGGKREKASLQVGLRFEEGVLNLSIYLPLKGEKKPFHRMYIRVPRYGDARQRNLVTSLEEYVAALARVFEAARDKRFTVDSLLRSRFGDKAEKLLAYLKPTIQGLEEAVAELKGKYEDGRFLKTIEDLVLAVSLKHDLQYDFVVGNPPYVRIQKIPEHVKEYWTGKYEWTEHNYDLYVPFIERCVRSAGQEGWLGKGGRLGFILSDRFLNVDYGSQMREHMPEEARIELLLDFRDTRVFAEALNYPAILIAEHGTDGKKGHVEAARIFTSDVDADVVFREFRSLRKKLATEEMARGDAVEIFRFPRARLTGPGWWIAPAEETKVLDKLRSAAGKSLLELTATRSGGFAGYQTSADALLVFDEAEDLGKLVKVWPRHEAEGCGCGEKPIEIEKEALRPFLFGKDVKRWGVDWKHSWLLFPYAKYQRKRILDGQIIEEWNLVPCKDNVGEFEFLHPEKIKLFEDRFPCAWKYLRKHEKKLRAREENRFAEDKEEGRLWYGATYPRGLDYYFRPKLVLQLLSRRNSFALDQTGEFVFQAGGKGGGVYGIAPAHQVGNLQALFAFLNSRIVDFIVKEVSSVYGGRFYSYADQFLKDLPVAEAILDARSAASRRLGVLAEELTKATERRLELRKKFNSFPESFERDLLRYELDTVKNLATASPSSAQMSIETNSISVEKTLYGFQVNYGSQRPFDFEDREHAECLALAFRVRGRSTLPLVEALAWRLPIKAEGCKRLLGLVDETIEEIKKLAKQVEAREAELNDLTYRLYDVTPAERKVIEEFLDRYSSHAAGVHSLLKDHEGADESPED